MCTQTERFASHDSFGPPTFNDHNFYRDNILVYIFTLLPSIYLHSSLLLSSLLLSLVPTMTQHYHYYSTLSYLYVYIKLHPINISLFLLTKHKHSTHISNSMLRMRIKRISSTPHINNCIKFINYSQVKFKIYSPVVTFQ